MTQKGPHTWDINIEYHRCPECGFIFENRDGYRLVEGMYKKELQCRRCGHNFAAEKKKHTKFGPLFGEPQPPEWDWGWQ